MKNPPLTRFYFVRCAEERTAWARVWITDDGCITILSDFGNFGYWFGAPGSEFRKFLTGCGPDYLFNKFTSGNCEACDTAGSVEAIQKHICRLRRDGTLTRDAAREEWELIRENNEFDEFARVHWYEETQLESAHELPRYVRDHANDVAAFMRHLWPGFVEQLKAELGREAALSALGSFPADARGES